MTETAKQLTDLSSLSSDPHATHTFMVTCTAVDAFTGTCTVDSPDGGGDSLTDVQYVGPAPVVDATVLYVTFDNHGIVIGGTTGSGSGGGSPGAPPVLQVFTSNGSWTPPAGATFIRVRCVAGGGGGGGAGPAAAGANAKGGGGGGGATVESTLDVSTLVTPVPVTVGAGGTAGLATGAGPAGNGTASMFGSYVRADGGLGGDSGPGTATPIGAAGGYGGSPTTGQLKSYGGGGASGYGATSFSVSGAGGASTLGGGGRGLWNNANGQSFPGQDGGGFGGGGGGAAVAGTGSGVIGGKGANGVVIVEVLPAGTPGATGAVGPAGPTGPQGATGATGAASTVPGPAGPAGATGPAGAQGPQGIAGPTGSAGLNAWLKSGAGGLSGVPAPPGYSDYLYVDVNTGDVWAAQAGGSFVLMGNIRGPAGPQGIKGDTGATGPAGPALTPGAALTWLRTNAAGTATEWSGLLRGGDFIVTAAPNFTVTNQFVHYIDAGPTWRVIHLTASIVTANQIGTSSSVGNIGDTTIANLMVGARPLARTFITWSAQPPMGFGYINTTGEIVLSDMLASQAVAAGATISFTVWYVVAL